MRTINKICPFCGENIRKSSHLNKCNPNVNEKDAYDLMIEKTYGHKSIEIMEDYLNGLSLPDIKKKYGIPYKTTEKILMYSGYSTRTIKESCNQNRTKKYVDTVLMKYGVDNVSKLDEIKSKKNQTFLKNYGVDNVFKIDGFAHYVSNICLERYGKKRLTNPELISERRLNFDEKKWSEIHAKTRESYQKKYDDGSHIFSSKIENIVQNVLTELNIPFLPQKFVCGRSFDLHILNTNILIEINGDFWHGNPQLYESTDILSHPGEKITAKQLWEKDRIKKYDAEKKGYRVIYIWEKDIYESLKNNTLTETILKSLSWREGTE